MKWIEAIIVALIGVVAVTGLDIATRGERPPQNEEAVVQALGKGLEPDGVFPHPDALDLDRMYWDPAYLLPQSHTYPQADLRNLFDYAMTCVTNKRPQSTILLKAWKWHRHVCENEPLGRGYFSYGRAFHPSGSTYSYLALARGMHEYDVIQHPALLSRIHLLEARKLGIANAYTKKFTGWGRSALEAYSRADVIVWTSQLVYLRIPEGKYPRPGYHAFPVTTIMAQLDSIGLELKLSPFGVTFEPKTYLFSASMMKSIFWIEIALLGTLLLTWVGLRILRSRRQMEERNLVLRTLAHEIRTPIASLKISLETLRHDFDQLPESSQNAFFHLSDEIRRLRRIAESSKQYLVGVSGMRPEPQVIPSIRSYCESLMEETGGKVDFELRDDFSLNTVEYWLRVGLRNLLDNAIKHGKGQVRLKVHKKEDGVAFDVSDEGQINPSDMKDFLKPFVKGESSSGLGLGMALIKSAARKLGGRLEVQSAPTSFQFFVKETL